MEAGASKKEQRAGGVDLRAGASEPARPPARPPALRRRRRRPPPARPPSPEPEPSPAEERARSAAFARPGCGALPDPRPGKRQASKEGARRCPGRWRSRLQPFPRGELLAWQDIFDPKICDVIFTEDAKMDFEYMKNSESSVW
ncbi:Hypothetical predicted protein [Podarcis lilfordi]|uniref:Uncharacterized protein n=1 Tax=Podarcis lilfordi TaxID=74358 RepID=A0AA35KAJ8_9SAUR|nr:Hypothetical predicted protein [Podarcis lilfordi]